MDETQSTSSLARKPFFSPTHIVISVVIGIVMLILGVAIGTMMAEKSANQIMVPPTQVTTDTQPIEPNKTAMGIASTAPASGSQQLANPASQNCIAQGGTLSIQTRGDGGQYGLCNFDDAYACEEWALYRGECPKGGVRTTGYDNIAQKYCAWLGGQTLAVKNANCNLPNGKVCKVEELYNGKCPTN